jgi:uncharacterized protein (DUF2147 family)
LFERRYVLKKIFTIIGSVMAILVLMGIGTGSDGDVILGNWLTDEGEAEVEIYKCGGEYCGKIVWLKEPKNDEGKDKTDTNNPDPEKRDRRIVGLNIVWGFKYDKYGKWVKGKIYDPDNGKTYSCKMTLESDNLNVRGYVGISLLGRTTVWTRVERSPKKVNGNTIKTT